jgi:hypothetical protein
MANLQSSSERVASIRWAQALTAIAIARNPNEYIDQVRPLSR